MIASPPARPVRLALVLPVVALLVSALLLLPYRGPLASQIAASVAPMVSKPATPPAAGSAEERRYAEVAALNLPALLAELPTALLSDDRSSWSPAGMDFRVWRALIYPHFGVFFWWLIGRGVDALLTPATRLRWFESTFAALLLAGGAIFCIGWFTATTAEDRADTNLHWIALGVLFWLLLEIIPVTAGILRLPSARAAKRNGRKP